MYLQISLFKHWLKKTNQKPFLAALEKMQEEMQLLGFVSLLLIATSDMIANICIPEKFYNDAFAPCTRSEIAEETEKNDTEEHKLLMASTNPRVIRRILDDINKKSCNEGYEPFVSHEGLEQLHRYIFIIAVTHISFSCLTMLLAIVKIHSWRTWENEAQIDPHNCSFSEIPRHVPALSQTSLIMVHRSNPLFRNTFLIWVACFLRQFWNSLVRSNYLTLRKGFIMSVFSIRLPKSFAYYPSLQLVFWNVIGSNLYFWIAIIPIFLVLLVGTKLQHVVVTLVLENAEITDFFSGAKLTPRDELFWFKKPELLLSLIHFILFQNAFELATFCWSWWEFGNSSCFNRNHLLVYSRLILGFIGQFICSYSTLPLYALVTHMGTNYKAALIPESVRATIDVWGKAAKRNRKQGKVTDDFELEPLREETSANNVSSRPVDPVLRPSASVNSELRFRTETIPRSTSMPREI
ncbi:MLO-like protein 11 [Cajanus cajan]|uniref:MLO-like protein 11 n=1 Tax=Cajanus cajan TaxID=3821 RepID=UPI0010FB48BF|nr:MLO-like protein 11 [Cajanus cajan]